MLFLDKRDFVACVGEASQTAWSGSGIEAADPSRHGDTDAHEEEAFFYDKQGFEELESCGITDEEFAKRNVCAFNVSFLTPPGDDGGESVGDGREGGAAVVPAAAWRLRGAAIAAVAVTMAEAWKVHDETATPMPVNASLAVMVAAHSSRTWPCLCLLASVFASGGFY